MIDKAVQLISAIVLLRPHVHNIEYGQECGDLRRNLVQMRCADCGYKSYSLARSL